MPSKKHDDWLSMSYHDFIFSLTLAIALFGCSTEPRSPPAEAGVHSRAQALEQCSFFAEMACSTVTLLSGEGLAAATCSAYRASDGTRVEMCGADAKAATTQARVTNNTYPVRLSWADNSNDESGFVIERCEEVIAGEDRSKRSSCAGEWKPVGAVAANITSYVDQTALLKRTYFYRVKAINDAGSSNYTGEVSVTTPSQ
jgi:hypothetical protein